VAVTEDHIPVYVRGGAFIPMIQTIQNTTHYNLDNFDLHYYFDPSVEKSSGHLYNDDGQTPNAFEKEQYELLQFNSTNDGKTLLIKLTSTTGKKYTATEKNVALLVHNMKPKRIFVDGQQQVYKTFQEPLQINVALTKNHTPEIKIEY